MKPSALIATLALGWVAIGIFLLQIIFALSVLLSYSSTPAQAHLLLIGVPLLISALLGGTLIGIARRSPVARILYAVVAGLTLVLAIIGIAGNRLPALAILITCLHMMILVASVICSFLPGVSRWMAYGQGSPGAAYGAPYPPNGYGTAAQSGTWQPQQAWHGQTGPGAQGGEAVQPGEAVGAAVASRACPHCAEPIRVEAIKCRYCGSAVTPLA